MSEPLDLRDVEKRMEIHKLPPFTQDDYHADVTALLAELRAARAVIKDMFLVVERSPLAAMVDVAQCRAVLSRVTDREDG